MGFHVELSELKASLLRGGRFVWGGLAAVSATCACTEDQTSAGIVSNLAGDAAGSATSADHDSKGQDAEANTEPEPRAPIDRTAPEGLTDCQLGGWSGQTPSEFVALDPGSILPLVGTAQTSLRIELGLQLDRPGKIATFDCLVALAARTVDGGAPLDAAARRSRSEDAGLDWQPQSCSAPLDTRCGVDDTCVWAPLHIGTRGLTDDPFALDYLGVVVAVVVTNTHGRTCRSELAGTLLRQLPHDAG